MKRYLNLILALLVLTINMAFAIGNGRWFDAIGGAIVLYYFVFVVNLFRKQYDQENILTKIFFDFSKAPIYISGIIVIAIVFIRKANPDLDFTYPYAVAGIGVMVSLLAKVKRSQKIISS